MNPLEKILNALAAAVHPGVTTMQIEIIAQAVLATSGLEPVFKGYEYPGHEKPYEFVSCISVNNEVIHGVPSDRKIEEGDVVKIDIGFKDADGLIWDGATTVIAGTHEIEIKGVKKIVSSGSATARKLVAATREALEAGVQAAKAGKTNLTITEAIEAVAKKYEFNVVVGYGGHGVGEKLHQDPFIANAARDVKGEPVKLESGMRIAIEPMFCTANPNTYKDKNGWTVKTPAGIAAHFETTIAIA